MTRTRLTLVLVLMAACLAGAADPPYKRLLQGEEAAKAAALSKRIDALFASGQFEEAVVPAKELLALRKRVQGEGHWETADAARKVATLARAAGLPAEKRSALAEAPRIEAKAIAFYRRGQYVEAEPLFRKTLAIQEEVQGPRHPDTASGFNNLAANLTAQGRAKEAEPLLRKALAIQEEVLGPRHPDTATNYNNLASNLDAQGRAKEAEPLLRKALAIQEVVIGPRHPNTATTYHNLGANLQAQGQFKEAEPLYRKGLAIQEEELGPRHRDTSLSYNNLADNLQALGRLKEAEPLYRKALAIWEELLGPRHPTTAMSYNGLALSVQRQGRVKEAEPLHRQALAIWEEVLGPRHPNTATSYNDLAHNLIAQGRIREAEPLFRRALAVWEEVMGPRHRNTAMSRNNLAANLDDQGRRREAEPLYRQALVVFEEVLGPGHTDTVMSCNNLASNLHAQGRTKEAEPLLRKALAAHEALLGPRHPQTALSCNNLAVNLDDQGRHKEAESLHRKALAIREEALGPRHPDTAGSWNNLASNLRDQGRAKEAEALSRKALAAWEEVLGPCHPDTARGYNNLALYLHARGDFKEAEPLWTAAAAAQEAARQRLAASGLDRAAAVGILQPHFGLAACRVRLGRSAEAWAAAEAGLARGLLDDLTARTALAANPAADLQDRARAARRDVLDRVLTPLLTPERLTDAQRKDRDELLAERRQLDQESARTAARRSRQAVLPLADVQAALARDAALVFWMDLGQLGEHWGCVLRRSGPPVWVRLPGSGADGVWTKEDDALQRLLRDDLAHNEADANRRARQLAKQRLAPLEARLAATTELPAVQRLIVVPVGRMAGMPVEVLTDRYLISYAPSGTMLARLAQKHRPVESSSLLALGAPNFTPGDAGRPPLPPNHGLYLAVVLPDGNAGRAGLRGGDVLLRYGGVKLATRADLKPAGVGEPIAVVVWRAGKVLDDLRLAPGKLGVVVSDDPPAVALGKIQQLELLTDARNRADVRPLPGTRLEVAALAALLPGDKSTLLLGPKASEQELARLASSGQLKQFRLLHLATHGKVDPISAAHSALLLARDRLPGVAEQGRLVALGKKVPTGVLSVETIANDWQLDADVVTLSACETALGPDGGGEGLLGFAQVLLSRGARSLLLSLWKVDDTATALLMMRFYQNVLGKREGLKEPLGRAEALREAKRWLRELPRRVVEKLAGQLAEGAVRASEEPKGAEVSKPVVPVGDKPFAHPRYWAAFILIG